MDSRILIQVALTLLTTFAYLFCSSLAKKLIHRFAENAGYKERRIIYVKKFLFIILFAVLSAILFTIWGIEFKGVFIFTSSFVAVLGVTLFASWSVLSNITSSVIIFFSFPCKIEDKIKILDGENSISGEIVDMTLFHILIKDSDNNVVSYPNNLAVQKPIIKILS